MAKIICFLILAALLYGFVRSLLAGLVRLFHPSNWR